MEIDFARNKDRAVFNNRKLLVQTYEPDNAKRIMRRMLEFQAAYSLQDIPITPPARRHKLVNRMHEYAVDIKHPFRLVFTLDPSSAKTADGAFDLARITRIIILRVEDYHGR